MSAILGFAGDMTSFVVGTLMSLAFFWFILSYWLDGAKLILGSVAFTFGLYISGALLAPGLGLGWRLLAILVFLLLGAATARYWIWRDARNHGPGNG